MSDLYRPYQFVCAALLITAATLASYLTVLGNGFVSYDDVKYIIENDHVSVGLTLDGLRWALTSTYDANWFPVTWLSHMADVSMFGFAPRGHHLVSLLLHCANALMLTWLLAHLTGQLLRSAVAGLLFAIHPIHVESVAWIAERKDVLSTLFFMLTVIVYIAYTRRPAAGRYLAALLLYALGLASKPMLVSLPLVLLLLDFWPLRRLRPEETDRDSRAAGGIIPLFREKIPFFVLSGASCILTYAVQSAGAAVNSLAISPPSENAAHAMVNYVRYLGKAVWPTDLAVLYPYVQELPYWQTAGSIVILVLITAWVYLARLEKPYLLFGWLWFLVTMAPVAGFVSIGVHSIADRYTYIPLTGLSVMAVWLAADLSGHKTTARIGGGICVIALLFCLGAATRIQTGYWKDSVSLFEHTLAVTRDNWVIHNNLAAVLLNDNQPQKALSHLLETIRIVPGHANAYSNLGALYSSTGDIGRAIRAYRTAIELNPALKEAYFYLCMAQLRAGEVNAAGETHAALKRVDPDMARSIDSYIRIVTAPK